MLKINIVTLFPQAFEPFLTLIPFKNLIKSNELAVNLVNIRDFGLGNYNKVDDAPYGGGPGMVLMLEPIVSALESCDYKNGITLLLSPRGKRFTQDKAVELAQTLSAYGQLTLICGRYEGIDARVEELSDEVLSLGDFVLSGGEGAAICILEAVLRLVPGGIGSEESLTEESFNKEKEGVEYPQYTRPEEFRGMKVPPVILSGNHKEIAEWREKQRMTN